MLVDWLKTNFCFTSKSAWHPMRTNVLFRYFSREENVSELLLVLPSFSSQKSNFYILLV